MNVPIVGIIATVLCAAVASAQQVPFVEAVARLKLPTARERLSALEALEASKYPEAAEPIAALLNDPVDEVRRAAVHAELSLFLGARIETSRRVGLVLEVRDVRPAARAFDADWASLPVARVPIAVVIGLVGLLRDPDPVFRIEVTYALGVLGQADASPVPAEYVDVAARLAERLGDPDPLARAAVARVAGRVFRRCPASCEGARIDALVDALVRTLNDTDPGVRLAAMGALGDLRSARAVPSLTAAYADYRKGGEALAALDALARIGDGASMATFDAARLRKEEAFRLVAAEGLARVGSPEALAAIRAALAKGPTPALQLVEAFALCRAGQRPPLGRIIQSVIPRATRMQAQVYLIELGPSAAGPVAAALRSAAYQSSDPDARIALIEVIGAVGGPGDVAVLDALRRDRHDRVAAAAERAATRLAARK